MPEPRPQTGMQRFIFLILMSMGFVVLFGIAVFGKDRVGDLFSGSLKYLWIGVLLAIGYFSAHLRK